MNSCVHSSSVLWTSYSLSWRVLASFEKIAKFIKSRTIPMHNFLLRYFPAYRTRMFPTVACNMCACPCKLQVYAYVYVQACPGAIERNAEERKDEWARENCRLNRVDDLCSAKRLPSALHDRNSFCQLNNLEVLFVLGLISDNLSIWDRILFIILS